MDDFHVLILGSFFHQRIDQIGRFTAGMSDDNAVVGADQIKGLVCIHFFLLIIEFPIHSSLSLLYPSPQFLQWP